ncbi:hypothetical protein [Corynebacterium anserum]|uniref:Secreted protein n=1 Tax=Corynebacterium anserum TaxID=2684406 RepID=A0A7G7YLG5_9CORY|nr:hypothetical protein [Corynebacterium anserum]QNH95335.1 hypothetical protein GP473_00200 [Corynebacterium anserum]
MSKTNTRIATTFTGVGLATAAAILGVTIMTNAQVEDPAHSPQAEPSNTAKTSSDVNHSSTVKVAVDGLVKPNSELTVYSPCHQGDLRAQITSSFGVEGKMGPAADLPALVGSITLPNQIHPAKEGKPNTITVTCISGESGTVTLNGYNEHGAGDQELLDLAAKK